MKKFLLLAIALLFGAFGAFAQTDMASEMFDLAKIKEGVRNRRISSYDKGGYNRDHLEPIKPGRQQSLQTSRVQV